MKPASSRSILLLVVLLASCMGEVPPPPGLEVTSPERGLVESEVGEVVVNGTTYASSSGSRVSGVSINGVAAKVAGDGSFTAVVPVPAGAMLLETVAVTEEGGKAIDARAIHVGQRRPVGSSIERAFAVALSADAFARISEAATNILNSTDLSALLEPISIGDSVANVKVTIGKLSIANAQIALTPTDQGLQLSIEVNGLGVDANAAYAGTLVPDGSTAVTVTADRIAIGGTLVVTPTGEVGFKTSVAQANISTTALKLKASGVVGTILDLLTNNLGSLISGITKGAAEKALGPLINKALGALGGPKHLDLLGKQIALQGSFSEVKFSNAGAMTSVNLAAGIAGGEASPGYISTPNGTPTLEIGKGLELALSDDLLNDMLAQVHALGILELHLKENFGLFDAADVQLMLPPMISGKTANGTARLVLGDMIVTIGNGGSTLVKAAINAQVDLAVKETGDASQIGLNFDSVHLVVNLLDDNDEITASDLRASANAGVALQLDSLEEVVISVPAPAIAGLSFDGFSLRGDNGYVVAGTQIH